jgi:hypothetical protein
MIEQYATAWAALSDINVIRPVHLHNQEECGEGVIVRMASERLNRV